MSIPTFLGDVEVVQKLSDLPNANEGLTAAELKAKFDEAAVRIKTYINETLVPAIQAANVPFQSSTTIAADNVQAAILEVQGQIRDAVTGTLVNGSVTREKLEEELLNRVFGGLAWVSMDEPAESDNTATDFPVGQMWMRPGFAVKNEAKAQWNGNGCTVEDGVVKGNKTSAAATAAQSYTGLGNAGDRILILFDVTDKSQEVTGISLRINAEPGKDVSEQNTVEAVLTEGGSLTLELTTTWSAAALAETGWTIKDFTVVNLDAAVRQTENAREPDNWAAFLRELVPFDRRDFPAKAWMQTKSGLWWPVMEEAREDGYLKSVDGQPKWMTTQEVAVDMNAGRIMSGSYVGTGREVNERIIELPVAPKLLLVSPDGGPDMDNNLIFDNPEVFQQGATVKRRVFYRNQSSGSSVNWYCSAALKENTLILTSESSFYGVELLNRSGVTYHWTAIY